jgi:hypothetical protein
MDSVYADEEQCQGKYGSLMTSLTTQFSMGTKRTQKTYFGSHQHTNKSLIQQERTKEQQQKEQKLEQQ